MRETFNLEDIFNVMIELETLGHDHYLAMEKLTDDYKLKELFSQLASQEEAHKKLYTKFKNEKIQFESSKVNPEYEAYMDSLLKGTITFLEESKNVSSLGDGLSIAINLEKDTILFLSELKEIIDPSYYDSIDNVMNQERKHLQAIYNYKIK